MHPALTKDETHAEFFARISSPPTPALDKLEALWEAWKLDDLQEEAEHAERQRQARSDAEWEDRARDGEVDA